MARVHHLSCASLCPRGGVLVGGRGGPWSRVGLVAHCLLVQGDGGLLLVDTGFGLGDVADPSRLGQPFRAIANPQLRREHTALVQLEALGHEPGDVRDIALTHLDLDHAGGLADFPEARVHVHAVEHEAAMSPSARERPRYIRPQWDHGPRWELHEPGGDEWFGFESLRLIPGFDEEIVLVPLPGHTRGHSGVAVRNGDGWLLHCGDAYFHHNEMNTPPGCPPALRAHQAATGYDGAARARNQERLRELRDKHGGEVDLFCSHDPHDLTRFTTAR